MDTKNDNATVPSFKVARVGKERKKKGGALSWFRQVKPGSSFSGATGGMGAGSAGVYGAAAAATGLSSFQVAFLAIVAAAFVGAMTLGALAGQSTKPKVADKKGFDHRDAKLEGDTKDLPTNANSIPNSLGYISGSVDGLTPEERARRKAEEDARLAAEEEARKKAEEDAAKKDQTAGQPAVDPNALLASAQKDGAPAPGGAGSPFGRKFGSLSSSLSGGAGLSGGVGRGFSAPTGGTGGFKGGQQGKLSGNRTAAKPTYSKAGRASLAASNVKGFARKQLANASGLSRRGATASKGETAAYDAGSAFDNNQGAGNVITGAGVGGGGKPQTQPDAGGGINTNGSPTGTQTTPCQETAQVNADCSPKKDPGGKNVTEYQWMYDLAMGLLMLTTVLAVVAIAVEKIPVYGTGVAQAIRVGIIAIGAIIAALGVAIMAMTSDIIAGGILALTGAYVGYTAYTQNAGAFSSEMIKQTALKFIPPLVLGSFAASMAHKPAAASQ